MLRDLARNAFIFFLTLDDQLNNIAEQMGETLLLLIVLEYLVGGEEISNGFERCEPPARGLCHGARSDRQFDAHHDRAGGH